MTQTPLTLRRWQRPEYERLVRLGVFRGEPVELIGGQLLVAEPQHPYHASAITKVDYALRAVLPPGWIVRIQAPVSLDDESEPEPDLVVVRGRPGDYRESHPNHTDERGPGRPREFGFRLLLAIHGESRLAADDARTR